MRRKNNENRRIKRYLLRKGISSEETTTYADNLGIEYDYKWAAKMSSCYNIIMGCFRNGFPIAVPKLWYNAWAFYPFFFIKKDLNVKDPIPILNHERIHIRQQRDIHLVVSLPLIFVCLLLEWFGDFNPIYLLCSVPFIPTIVYGIEFIRTYKNMVLNNSENISLQKVRENTCFEREAIIHATNADYIAERKFWAVLAYTGWKKFKNYGLK